MTGPPGPVITVMENSGSGGGGCEVLTVTVEPTERPLNVAVTLYEPEEPLPVDSVIDACPLLSIVALVELNDIVPSSGLTLNVTV